MLCVKINETERRERKRWGMVRLGICATREIRRRSWTKGLVCNRETQVKGWPHPLAQRSPLCGVPGRERAESNGGSRGMAEQARDLPRMGMLLGAELLWTPWRIHFYFERLETMAEFLMEKLEVAVMFLMQRWPVVSLGKQLFTFIETLGQGHQCEPTY